MYQSSERSGPLIEQKTWLSVKLEQLLGTIEDGDGASYHFEHDRKLLTASSFELDEDGRSMADGITFKMIVGGQDEPSMLRTGDQEVGLSFIDLEQGPTDNILAIVQAAKNIPILK